MTISAEPNQEAITTLKVQVTEKRPDGSTQVYKTDIAETSFSVTQVRDALGENFEILGVLGEQKFTNWTNEDNKVVFVCRRK